jgi:hypothetical protein
MSWTRHVAWMEEMRSAYKILIRKPKEWRPLERPNRRCDSKIIWILKK